MSFPTAAAVRAKINQVIKNATGIGVILPPDHAECLTGEEDDVGIMKRYEAEKISFFGGFGSLQAGWTGEAASQNVATLKADGTVVIRARVKNNGSGGTKITESLPEAIRPPVTVSMIVAFAPEGISPASAAGGTGIARLSITTGGDVFVSEVNSTGDRYYYIHGSYTVAEPGGIQL